MRVLAFTPRVGFTFEYHPNEPKPMRLWVDIDTPGGKRSYHRRQLTIGEFNRMCQTMVRAKSVWTSRATRRGAARKEPNMTKPVVLRRFRMSNGLVPGVGGGVGLLSLAAV